MCTEDMQDWKRRKKKCKKKETSISWTTNTDNSGSESGGRRPQAERMETPGEPSEHNTGNSQDTPDPQNPGKGHMNLNRFLFCFISII